MPYIKQKDRKFAKEVSPVNAGELNLLIHLLIEKYVNTRGESYQVYNDIVGVLECAKMELYRRKIGPYEDKKKIENGDISFYETKENG